YTVVTLRFDPNLVMWGFAIGIHQAVLDPANQYAIRSTRSSGFGSLVTHSRLLSRIPRHLNYGPELLSRTTDRGNFTACLGYSQHNWKLAQRARPVNPFLHPTHLDVIPGLSISRRERKFLNKFNDKVNHLNASQGMPSMRYTIDRASR